MHCWLTGWLGDVILSRSDSERQRNLMIHDQRPLPVYFSQISYSSLRSRLLAQLLTRTTQEVHQHMCMSNLLYNINKYESPHWLSPGDATLWQDYVCPGLYNGSYGNWSVATNPCSIHLKGLYIVPIILRYQCNTF